jgi:phospholipase/carboxylesterase
MSLNEVARDWDFMRAEVVEYGGLKCRVVAADAGDGPLRVICVLCHGYGAPGTDLVPFAAEMFQMNPNLRGKVKFVFPEAPLSLEVQGMPGGRAWWHLDVMRMMAAAETGNFSAYRTHVPAGMDEVREKMTTAIAEMSQSMNIPVSRFVLGGFSQGSMIMTDVALRLEDAPAALCVLSGTLLCEAEWRELAAKRGPLRVLQSHGHQDQILPFGSSEWLRDLFLEAGFSVEFLPFEGGHSIPYETLHRVSALLEEATAS